MNICKNFVLRVMSNAIALNLYEMCVVVICCAMQLFWIYMKCVQLFWMSKKKLKPLITDGRPKTLVTGKVTTDGCLQRDHQWRRWLYWRAEWRPSAEGISTGGCVAHQWWIESALTEYPWRTVKPSVLNYSGLSVVIVSVIVLIQRILILRNFVLCGSISL